VTDAKGQHVDKGMIGTEHFSNWGGEGETGGGEGGGGRKRERRGRRRWWR
jgi:hypothetical protein